METLQTKPHSRRGARQKAEARFRRFIITLLITAIMFGSIGGIVGFALARNFQGDATQAEEAEPENAVVETAVPLQSCPTFGAIDDRIFTQEISLDWGAGDLEYIPLTDKLDTDIQEFIFYLCAGYNLDFSLVMALIQQESEFNPNVISSTNDYGLMQINRTNHAWLSETLGISDFLDPYQNVRAGTFVLRKLFERYDDTNMVLMAYNMGEGNASKLWAQGIYSTSYTENVARKQAAFYNN